MYVLFREERSPSTPYLARSGSVYQGAIMFEKVLFPTDFSEYAKKTLDCVAGFPGARDVILLHVLDESRSPRGGGRIGEVLSRTDENFFKEEKHRLETLGQNLRVTTAVKTSSDIAGAILETAEERGVSLIVIGARGNNLVEGVLLGSVSMAVLRRCRTNVLICRHKIIEEMKAKTYEMFCPMILSRILCPVDFSQYSDHAIDLLSTTKGVGEVILLHVVSQGETEHEIEDALQKAKEQAGAIHGSLSAQGIKVRTIVRTGDPTLTITGIADEEDVSVIWMSSQGKGWFRDLLLGSTAYTVAMNAQRPVIIIRSPE
jgi:nucleotide-binding universal stress UspA family protein